MRVFLKPERPGTPEVLPGTRAVNTQSIRKTERNTLSYNYTIEQIIQFTKSQGILIMIRVSRDSMGGVIHSTGYRSLSILIYFVA